MESVEKRQYSVKLCTMEFFFETLNSQTSFLLFSYLKRNILERIKIKFGDIRSTLIASNPTIISKLQSVYDVKGLKRIF